MPQQAVATTERHGDLRQFVGLTFGASDVCRRSCGQHRQRDVDVSELEAALGFQDLRVGPEFFTLAILRADCRFGRPTGQSLNRQYVRSTILADRTTPCPELASLDVRTSGHSMPKHEPA